MEVVLPQAVLYCHLKPPALPTHAQLGIYLFRSAKACHSGSHNAWGDVSAFLFMIQLHSFLRSSYSRTNPSSALSAENPTFSSGGTSLKGLCEEPFGILACSLKDEAVNNAFEPSFPQKGQKVLGERFLLVIYAPLF